MYYIIYKTFLYFNSSVNYSLFLFAKITHMQTHVQTSTKWFLIMSNLIHTTFHPNQYYSVISYLTITISICNSS